MPLDEKSYEEREGFRCGKFWFLVGLFEGRDVDNVTIEG